MFACVRFNKQQKIIVRRMQKKPAIFSCSLIPFDKDVKMPLAEEKKLLTGDPAMLARLLPFAANHDDIMEFTCLVTDKNQYQTYSPVDVHDRNDWFQLFDFLAKMMDDSLLLNKLKKEAIKVEPHMYVVWNTFFDEKLKCPFAKDTCIVCSKPHKVVRFKDQCDCEACGSDKDAKSGEEQASSSRKRKKRQKKCVGFFHCQANACSGAECQKMLAELHKAQCRRDCEGVFSDDEDDDDNDDNNDNNDDNNEARDVVMK